MPNRARTIGLVRLLKSLGGLRKTPGRVPRQQQPDGIRVSYYRALQRVVLEPLFRSTEQIKEIAVRGLERLRASEAKRDASGFHPATPRDVIRRLAEKQIEEFDPKPLREVVARFGRQTSAFQKEQLDRQVRSAVGVPFSAIERPARDPIPMFVDENVKLIKTVPERYFERIQRLVEKAYSTGMRPETLAEKLQELDDISDSDAMRIARDQIGKLNAQFNEERLKSIGVDKYIWRTAKDNRVRDEHAEREGEEFAWNAPPPDGHPGEAIQCRCYAEPVFNVDEG